MKRRKMTLQDKNLIKAHNESKNGLKLGKCKSELKGNSDTPLFFNDNQRKLF
jgi:hypothetical protein